MTNVEFRVARRDDLSQIVALLADDPLGATREQVSGSLDVVYLRAFDAIERDERNEVIVGDVGGRVVAVLQITYIPGLTHQGAERAQIEGVRVAREYRGHGVGHRLFRTAIDRAADRGCRIVQLTTDKRRPEAHRFYQSVGFEATHEGMKLRFDGGAGAAAETSED